MKFYIKVILQKMIALLLLPLRLVPLRKDRILFLSIEGGSHCEYSCNPRYFCEYLMKQVPGEFTPVWLLRHPEQYPELRERGMLTARHFTPLGCWYAMTCGTVVSNGGYFTWFPFRKDQICINTWHGGGVYKRLENDVKTANRATRKRTAHAASCITAFLSGSTGFTRHVIRGAFRFRGDVLEYGVPRNDLLLSPEREEVSRRIRSFLDLPEDCRVILYAPTFRSRPLSADSLFSPELLLDALEKTDSGRWVILVRNHIQAGRISAPLSTDPRCIDLSGYPDTQELLCAADWLITDYSSIVWDYCLTDRPCLLYTPDLEDYIADRGFYVDIRDWGLPLYGSMKELLADLPGILAGSRDDTPACHRALLGCCESGRSSEELLAYIRRKLVR